MPELSLIDSIARQAAKQKLSPSILKGIGDDCAILRPPPGRDLVFTSDFFLEDRHFTRATFAPGDMGHKALARSLSDLAAMGASPLFCLVSLALPHELGKAFITDFYRGLLRLAHQTGISLAGGDLAQTKKITADVMCCGTIPRGQALLRNGAKPGHLIYVTGRLGGAAYALRRGSGSRHWKRLVRPQPRLAEGLQIARLASACIDISDGLSLDLHRLCQASGVSAELDRRIPVAPSASLNDALHGGDDYELLYTAPPRIQNLPGHRIGVIAQGKPGLVRFQDRPLQLAGFQHFQ